MTSTRITRLNKVYGPNGKIPVGVTKFKEDYVQRHGVSEFIPNTKVKRLRLISLGPRSVGAFEDEIDAVVEGLRRERDASPLPPPNPAPVAPAKYRRRQAHHAGRRREEPRDYAHAHNAPSPGEGVKS